MFGELLGVTKGNVRRVARELLRGLLGELLGGYLGECYDRGREGKC